MGTSELTRTERGSVVQSTLLIVLGTESLLFAILMMSYLFLRSGGSTMSFMRPKSFDLLVASLNTGLLLISAVTVWKAKQAIKQNHREQLKTYLLVTLLLGVIFISGQIFEFNHSGMKINDLNFGGVFFALISFHAAHVAAGMMILFLNLLRSYAGDFSARRHVAITAGTWFWSFVTAVWLVLFLVLYVF